MEHIHQETQNTNEVIVEQKPLKKHINYSYNVAIISVSAR